ncbi:MULTISPECIES: SRPBCC family protein [Methylobacterium]|uniref:IS1595 family transposase ISMpo2 n=1 Tax=Methylobacterium thuringiense TaxID=1003091 RepID=A0ABQ4TT13_9HYPH|nr:MULTISPECIES: SRPBCC family protein [Methylobacterium]TXN21043.1 SRPBCC family protein [Methylobacterium sp. WL9]GJE57771.1 IS1595 family transposase ISMpo2 [Methylobacterium thuringiense]
MLKFVIPAAALAVVAITPASALEVTKTATIAAAPDAVWKTIGSFCGISDWHPVVEKCELADMGGKKHRTLSLKGGGTLLEEEQARDDKAMSYTYTILEGPLPVSDYKSTIMVAKDGSGSKVTWSGNFKAKGAPDDKAQEAIGGVYEAGLKGLAEKTK